jgi:hypothetical protein
MNTLLGNLLFFAILLSVIYWLLQLFFWPIDWLCDQLGNYLHRLRRKHNAR